MTDKIKNNIFSIVSDYGYGDRGTPEVFYSEKEFVDRYNELVGGDYTTADEILWIDHPVYDTYDYEYEEDENHDWMSS